MPTVTTAIALLLVAPMLASGQSDDHHYRGQGYLFVAEEAKVGPAGGGGGEYFLYKGLGVGGEFVKAASPFGEYIGSANIYYHRSNNRDFEAFVTGGYTFFYVPGVFLPHANGVNFGVGVNGWLTNHAALRLEVRDTVGGRSISIDFEPSGNFYTAPNNVISFRIGVTFR